MTFSDLKLMLAQDVNRSDKETVWYPKWINRALRKIQTDVSFACMKSRASLQMAPGASSVNLPANFKELTAEQYPVTIIDPSLPGIAAELPCTVTSREEMVAYRASTYVPTQASNVRGRLSGLPVYLDRTSTDWTLNVQGPAEEGLDLRVSYYGFLAELVNNSDTNYFLLNYPDLVENKVKAIAFTSLNDPAASLFESMAAKLLAEAVLDDKRRLNRGRVLRMGG